jgi:hypothetical protein
VQARCRRARPGGRGRRPHRAQGLDDRGGRLRALVDRAPPSRTDDEHRDSRSGGELAGLSWPGRRCSPWWSRAGREHVPARCASWSGATKVEDAGAGPSGATSPTCHHREPGPQPATARVGRPEILAARVLGMGRARRRYSSGGAGRRRRWHHPGLRHDRNDASVRSRTRERHAGSGSGPGRVTRRSGRFVNLRRAPAATQRRTTACPTTSSPP